VRHRIRAFLHEKGLTGRAFGKRLGRGDQWVSNLLAGRFALSLDELDEAARALQVTPSELVHREEDGLWELRPTEMRLIRGLRAVPPVIRDHLVTMVEYLMGVAPEEIDLLRAYRQLTPEEQQRVQHGVDVLRLTQSVAPRTGDSGSRPETPRAAAHEAPALRRKTRV
jgi:transcriptional regulator with XRE-family HTH domain